MIEFILKLLKGATFKKFSNLVDQVQQYILRWGMCYLRPIVIASTSDSSLSQFDTFRPRKILLHKIVKH